MKKSDRGQKHLCAECATRYYDLNRSVIACPKCGVVAPPPPPPRAQPAARKPARPRFRSHP